MKEQKGQSLLEVIVAMAVFALIAGALMSLSLGGFKGLEQGGEHTQAEALVQESMEAVKAVRDRAWNELIFNRSTVSVSGDSWALTSEGAGELIGQFARTIFFRDVCRDGSNDIVDCPGSYVDVHTKAVTASTSWEIRPGVSNEVFQTSYMTNWDSSDWIQTDWSGGDGQVIWLDSGMYDTDSGDVEIFTPTGQMSLLDGSLDDSSFEGDAGISSYDWPFSVPANYTYDPNKIEVTSGMGQLKSQGGTTFRVTEYFLGIGDFSGNSYNLTLDQDLADDYFVILNGSDGDGSDGGDRGPDEDYAALTADPNGTGDLSVSGASDVITIERSGSVNSWVGVVTVVECLGSCDTKGFNLLDVQDVIHSNGSGSGTDTPTVTWGDINQVMLMGGVNGSGCRTPDTSATNHDLCHLRIWPTGADTINWARNKTNNDAQSTVMVIEWGSEWNVQRVTITGNNGGNGANTRREYNVGGISSVVRDNTWVWGTGYTTGSGTGNSAEGSLITLGNGADQNVNETFLAVGQEYRISKYFEVYALTHSELTVDYRFKVDGHKDNLTYDQTVDSASDSSARMSIVTNGCNKTGTKFPQPIFSARYINDTTVRLERRRSGENFPAWVQGIDFSGISGAGYPTDTPDIFPTSSFTVPDTGTWTSFSETTLKNGGEIYYQLSDDDGVSWQHWSGSSWAAAGASDYNTAVIVNSNISDFSTNNKKIRFRAFLESDGSQLVQLDNINISFAQGESPWSFAVWDVGVGENNPTGSHQSSGGNPDGYNDITIPNGESDEIGGYWQQEFENYRINPAPVTLDFDYKVIDFNGSPVTAEIRIYVDSGSGDPVTQVGSSIPISGTGSWISAFQIDLSGVVTTPGTYYLKAALWAETGGSGGSGPFTVGLDNIVVDLGNGKHPENGSLISSGFDTGSLSAMQVIEWDETIPACSPACTVRLQIQTAPDNSGVPGTWTPTWSGPEGDDGDATDFYTIADGTLIHTDHNGDQWIRYRVNLDGDGTDTPVMTEIKTNYK